LLKEVGLGLMGRKKVSSPLVLGKEAKMERIPMDFTELFCDVDDFCREFEPVWKQRQLAAEQRRRQRKQQLSLSERMTIIIAFHASSYRDFKHFYLMLRLWHRAAFPGLVIQLITSLRRNMKNILMPLMDKILLRKRSLIETVNDQLKNIAQVEHTRHRSVLNFAVNLVAGLISYARQPKKPTLRLHERDRQALNTHALPFVA
jgi:hypothetical protein